MGWKHRAGPNGARILGSRESFYPMPKPTTTRKGWLAEISICGQALATRCLGRYLPSAAHCFIRAMLRAISGFERVR